ncbi:hypothetical protein MNV49_007375 [Pseudohyphozyma bogoriensis]|nr:hypothetical protein MNV49_007375 [Pseudohyphozyma bogoriensis]
MPTAPLASAPLTKERIDGLKRWAKRKADGSASWSQLKAGDHVEIIDKRQPEGPTYFLVRSDHFKLLEAVKECLNRRRRLLIVFGQPGSGKTISVEWLLPRLVAAKIPVKLVTDHYDLAFRNGGRAGRAVAIYDAADWKDGLSAETVDDSNGLTVYITSECLTRIRDWPKGFRPVFFIPEVWTMDEVQKHTTFLLEKKRLWELSEMERKGEGNRPEETAQREAGVGVLAGLDGGADSSGEGSGSRPGTTGASQDEAKSDCSRHAPAFDDFFAAPADYDAVCLAHLYGTNARQLFNDWPDATEPIDDIIQSEIKQLVRNLSTTGDPPGLFLSNGDSVEEFHVVFKVVPKISIDHETGVLSFASQKQRLSSPLVSHIYVSDHLQTRFRLALETNGDRGRLSGLRELQDINELAGAIFEMTSLEGVARSGIGSYEMRVSSGTPTDTTARLAQYDIVFLQCTIADSHSFRSSEMKSYLRHFRKSLGTPSFDQFRVFYILVARNAEQGQILRDARKGADEDEEGEQTDEESEGGEDPQDGQGGEQKGEGKAKQKKTKKKKGPKIPASLQLTKNPSKMFTLHVGFVVSEQVHDASGLPQRFADMSIAK